MNLVRHELGFSTTQSRFPTKGNLPGDLFPLRECRDGRSRRCCGTSTHGAPAGPPSCGSCSPPMSRPSSARTCSITTISCSTGPRWWPSPSIAAELGGRFDHVLVDEYQDTNRLQSSILLALKPGGQGLTVVGDDAQSIYSFRAATVRNILDFPGSVQPAGRDRHARPQLPLDPADPGRGQCRDRARLGALHQKSLDRSRLQRAAAAGGRPRRDRSGPLCRRAGAGEPRERHQPQAAGGAVSDLASQRAAGGGADPPQHPLREVRRPEIPRRRPRQGPARPAAVCPEPARSGRRLPADAASARRRTDLGPARARSHA